MVELINKSFCKKAHVMFTHLSHELERRQIFKQICRLNETLVSVIISQRSQTFDSDSETYSKESRVKNTCRNQVCHEIQASYSQFMSHIRLYILIPLICDCVFFAEIFYLLQSTTNVETMSKNLCCKTEKIPSYSSQTFTDINLRG